MCRASGHRLPMNVKYPCSDCDKSLTMGALRFTTGIFNMKGAYARFFLLLFTLFVAACGTIDTLKDKQLASDLEVYLSRYESAMRWGNPQHAYGFLKPELAEETVIPEGMENIQISQHGFVLPGFCRKRDRPP